MKPSSDINVLNPEVEQPKVKLICLDLSRFSQTTQFALCCIAVFAFYILYGYMQELIFTLEGFKPFGWYLTLVQFGYYILFSLIQNYATHITRRK